MRTKKRCSMCLYSLRWFFFHLGLIKRLYCYRAFSLTWPASMKIYGNKRKRLQKKRVQLPRDWFGTPTWPTVYCFGTPIWPPWRHVKTLYSTKPGVDQLLLAWSLNGTMQGLVHSYLDIFENLFEQEKQRRSGKGSKSEFLTEGNMLA